MSLGVSPSHCLFFRLSISHLCSPCHLCSSLSLLLFFSFPSDRSHELPSGLFQTLAHTPPPSPFFFLHFIPVVTSCRNSSILLFDSIYLLMCVCVRLGLISDALALISGRSGGGQKQIWESLLCYFFFLFLPVHLVAYSRDGVSHCVFVCFSPERQPL